MHPCGGDCGDYYSIGYCNGSCGTNGAPNASPNGAAAAGYVVAPSAPASAPDRHRPWPTGRHSAGSARLWPGSRAPFRACPPAPPTAEAHPPRSVAA